MNGNRFAFVSLVLSAQSVSKMMQETQLVQQKFNFDSNI